MLRVEGYLPADTPLWMWEDKAAEWMVAVQEYWLARDYLIGERNRKPYYGVIFVEWPELAHLVKEMLQC